MSIAIIIIMVLALIFLIIAGIYAIVSKDLLQAAVATGVISLVLSIVFYILQAPDVALTEAAIGIALSTIIFVIAIRNTKRYEEE
jgi:uncharacterized MnhB-related membrane protein